MTSFPAKAAAFPVLALAAIPLMARAAPPDPFAPMRVTGAEWRYDVVARRGGRLTPIPGLAVRTKVLRAHDIVVPEDLGEPAGRYTLVELGASVGAVSVPAFVKANRGPLGDAVEDFGPTVLVIGPDGLRSLNNTDKSPATAEELADTLDDSTEDDMLHWPATPRSSWTADAMDASGTFRSHGRLVRGKETFGKRTVEVWRVKWRVQVCDSGHCQGAGTTETAYAPGLGITLWCSHDGKHCLRLSPGATAGEPGAGSRGPR